MYTLSLKLETELNVIALQTFPKMLRVLYAHIIKKEPLRIANKSRNDHMEFDILSALLVQNINRSKSRMYDYNGRIDINLIAVPKEIVMRASAFMKGSVINEITIDNTVKYNIKSRIINCLIDHIKSYHYKTCIELDNFMVDRGFFPNVKELNLFIEDNLKEINKETLKAGFELNINEDKRPYLLEIPKNFISDEELISKDTTRTKFLSNFVAFKGENIKEIKISDFKNKYNVKSNAFAVNYKKFEKDLKKYGIYRFNNSIIVL